MSKALSSRTARVLIIDPSSAVRQLLSDVVKGLGFREVTTASSCKDALGMLEFEDFQWIISPLMANDSANLLQLLKIFTEDVRTRQIRVSLIYEESESHVLPLAFELGLLSAHPKAPNRDTMDTEFKSLMAQLETSDSNSTLTSANYLHKILVEKRRYKIFKSFVERLLKLYPGSPDVLLKLAEAQFVVQDPAKAFATLLQVEQIYDHLKPKVEALSKKYLGSEDQKQPGVTGQNALGVRKVVVVDPDSDVQRKLKEFFAYAGVLQIICFDDGEAAWQFCNAEADIDLIIHEWRIPKLSGPQLLQRLRQKGLDVPIVVISSLIKREETPLVREMGVSAVILKPFDKFTFFKDLVWTLQQNIYPTELRSYEQKIRLLLRANKLDEAKDLLQSFVDNTTMPAGAKAQLTAEYAFARGKYTTAKNKAVEALKLSGDSLFMLNLLGKCFMKSGEFESALKCMEKAQSISPGNIERLCNIAEVQFDLGMKEEAKQTIADASSLDPSSSMVKEIDAEIALLSGDASRARRIMAQLDTLPNIVSFMNNRAVALIRCGNFDEGIQLYKDTFSALPNEWSDTHDIVVYNLGLAFVRHGDVVLALEQLELVKSSPESNLFRKTESLKKRLHVAKLTGESLVIHAADTSKVANDDTGQSEITTREVKEEEEELLPLDSAHGAHPGEYCCHLVFQAPHEDVAEAKKLIETLPKFGARKAIQKDT